MMQQRLTLANGLRVNLIHNPQASRSAALFYLSAGSHHEPEQWPGLAHLFEHVVFAGSRCFQGEQRLMSWAQAEGARLNATTLPASTAWFFDISAEKLADGFARLTDMLAYPLLSLEAITQETTVIDAEYRMLSADADTWCEAALAAAFDSPKALGAFHVGNLAHFGQDAQALQQALREYHQRFFHAENLTLWLSGPQSFKELTALAEQYARVFTAGDKPVPPTTAALRLKDKRSNALQQSSSTRLHLSFALKNTHWQDRQSLSLMRQFFSDEAQKSLLATLGEAGLCDSLHLMVPYCSENGSILTFEFILNSDEQAAAAQLENLFFEWLLALSQVNETQLSHYSNLAQKAFYRLSPVDKLRAEAFGFPLITDQHSARFTGWKNLLNQLNADNLTRLWVTPRLNKKIQKVQGFDLPLSPIDWASDNRLYAPELAFYPLQMAAESVSLPEKKAYLPHLQPHQEQGVFILSPALGCHLPQRWMYIIQVSLRDLIGHCAHLDGALTFENIHGQWLLQLSGSPQVIISTLAAVIDRLNTLTETLITQGERRYQQAQQKLQDDIAIRCLLNQLPGLLSGEPQARQTDHCLPETSWRATLYGGDSVLQESLAKLLSRFPGTINAPARPTMPPKPTTATYAFLTASKDAAVLLFCPLVEQTATCHAAWRIMASVFEPQFFKRLRVEMNIGYVVTCRFMRTAGEYGLLFAVQSPGYSFEKIRQEIRLFIADMAEIISHLPQKTLAEKSADLHRGLEVNDQDSAEKSREHWLNQHAYAPPLTPEAISNLTLSQLLHFYTLLAQKENHWWQLTNQNPVQQVQ